MPEHELSKQEFFGCRPALEFTPKEVRVWERMRPVKLTGCDRIVIIADGDIIEFHRDDKVIFPYGLYGDPPIYISNPCILPSLDRLFKGPLSNTEDVIEVKITEADKN